MATIIVTGGSLGGLLAANMLSRAGHQVTVLEKATTSLDGRGAGIVTHPLLVAAMERCGVRMDVSLGVSVIERVVLGKDGAALHRATVPQVLSSWSRLYALLLAALEAQRYVRGASVSQIRQDAQGVEVLCEDGRAFKADLVIASDGIRSVVRAQVAPDVQPEYAGYVAWRGVCDESALSQRTLDTLFDNFAFSVPPGELIIGYPVAGMGNSIARGQRRYNFVWYRPTPAGAPLTILLTDAEGNHYPQGIPPNKVAPRQIAGMRQAAAALLAPQFAEVLDQTKQPFLQPIHDCSSSAIAFGRVALMGDAAFVARPHVGMGVTKAAEDAMSLTDQIALHGATPQALQAFERDRLAPARAVVQRARVLGDFMQAQGRWGAANVARTMMLETAIDLAATPLEKITEFEQA
ncbi:MAG: monooxygenase [Polaromonas sp. 39-63-203]|jgi:2-polyprenyl-6-methoxyphenol hydroxylase-like FAD-dependent oxidoreductase|uniref:FAD binding domain-containing protein n=1 Tax=Polaromonas sp. TaxID=1869339 RepID=UPI000BDBA206|nr:FAD-dependent monooxygenase [Polaromonas sp.]OYY53098.1 MAG: monooxygenase [Polaromonas sp. 35-63-240]OYZ02424.1 MAG: monooxygenase [Polaromonas sp. 28-63-22]OYZ84216.1 MAG: monooxygenase [Polaromonas sp. 24-62-144]OZA99494.1 MAG: monooxygenase [Polaromonas sp. 39-63-203]HQS30211.1 FAD-dependent monooxygenase [Polaromonas sp.]